MAKDEKKKKKGKGIARNFIGYFSANINNCFNWWFFLFYN